MIINNFQYSAKKRIFILIVVITFLIFFLVIDKSLLLAAEDNPGDRPVEMVYVIPIKADIDPGMAAFVKKGIDEAEMQKADLIVFEISTFGGLVDSAIEIKDAIINSRIPSVTYVSERAWSAGALIALSGQRLVMTSGSSIGAAETRPKEEKYISALRKEFSATAELRGKNPDLAEAMVDEDIAIDGIIAEGKLLTLTALEASQNNISDFTVDNFTGFLEEYNVAEAEIVRLERSMKEIFADIVTRPIFSIILLSIGFIALISEAIIPGWGIGGTVGLLSLGLFFSGYLINGYAHWGLILLFIIGIVLMVLELFVVPGFGITGVGGLIAIFASLYFFFPDPNTALGVLAAVLVLSIIALVVLIKLFGVSKMWKNISLIESQSGETGYTSHSDRKSLLGAKGEALTHLRPAGTANVNGERIDVVTEGNYIEKGRKIKIIKVEGSRVVVKKMKEE